MVFSSTVFLFLFLPATLILYYLPVFSGDAMKRRRYRNGILLLTSLLFYAWGEPVFVFVMLLSILLNWLLARRMAANPDRRAQKRVLTVAVAFDAGLMFVFKYLSFLLKNIEWLFRAEGLAVEIALPIGISFFTFQIMSYVFDVYYGKAPVQKRFSDLALYISMFPQLIAGPIVRYETVAKAIDARQETLREFGEGFLRFCVGLSKKALIANYVALIADNMFALPSLSALAAWLGAIAYTLQIYFDFSGYSDMAIGLGHMFGFHFDENFNYPYTASSVTDFWRRWHISLSTWFRDYVYIPLGGSRNGARAQIRNLLVVWLLTGVWHGANWTFVVWGLYYFLLLALEKRTGLSKKNNVATHLYTLFFVMVGWVLFRAESFSGAGRYLLAMFGFGGAGVIDGVFRYYFGSGKWVLLIAIVAALPVVPWLQKRGLLPAPVRVACAVILFVLSVFVCVKSTYNPFIYFNF